ncbi:unnamed protein product [Ectocarpus sp. 13 AM-2016]
MVTPSVFAQAGVIFTVFHLYCYLGMALYGGVVTPGADFGDTPFANSPYYYENNFNSYPEGLVTLFELLVVNNCGSAAEASGGGDGSRDGGYSLFSLRFRSGLLGRSNKGSSSSAGGDGGGNGASSASGEMPPPPPRPPSAQAAKDAAPGSEATNTADLAAASAPAVWFPDPFQQPQQQPGRLSGLPENEEVVPESPGVSLEGARDLDLGWGKGGAEPPEPPQGVAGHGGRTRWGSGHFYKASRRNSYSDRDMFEGREDEEDVPMKILGAISIGLGNTMGIRAFALGGTRPPGGWRGTATGATLAAKMRRDWNTPSRTSCLRAAVFGGWLRRTCR